MPTIRTLSQSMINKIAAGEVIERPASVVKELVENSIDAGSTRIDVFIERGGADLIRIVDNGNGIVPDQLILALSPHATSKIADTDDLFRIGTFGFRGEALASIAEISQMSIRSRTPENNEGAEIRSNGGERTEPAPCGMPVGSQIEVRNLFFNTPVRRKYMKSTTTEIGHVTETFIRLVLPLPTIHFTLKHNGRIVYDLPPNDSPQARIRQIFGEDVAKDLIGVESRPGSVVNVRGFVSHPNQSRGNNRMQYFFLNNRFIRDRALQHALNEAYRGLLTVGRFPLAFLQIDLPPDMFDVNVHPTKMEVRFLDSNRIYSGFLGTIREKFLSSDLKGRFTTPAPKDQPFTGDTPPWESDANKPVARDPNDPRTALAGSATEETRKAILDWVKNIEPTSDEPGTSTPGSSGVLRRPNYSGANASGSFNSGSLTLHQLPDRPVATRSISPQPFSSFDDVTETSEYSETLSEPLPPPLSSDRVAYSPQGKLVVQMHDSYLIQETPEGIMLIDQHALHERVLYEQLKERMNEGRLESQRLLVPIPVDLAPNELACVLENVEFFKTLGLQVEPFGGETVLISAFPAILAKTPPTEILISLIEPMLEAGKKPDRTELLEEILHSMACKAAVKAGDRLRADAISRLVELGEKESNAHHCPHGRPSTIVFTREELDKMFKRS